MPRMKRADEGDCVYHALNRGISRRKLFHKPEDYRAFLTTLRQGLDRYPVDLLAFCLMPNHWHLVVRPQKDGLMGKLLGWVAATHTLRYHAHNHSGGTGHLYQGPFKSFPCQDDHHFLAVCRYVERNAMSGRLVAAAEDWEFGSLHRWHHGVDRDPALLTSWPIRHPPNWVRRVNEPFSKKELEGIRNCVVRNRPYGSEEWMEETCERTGLWATTRPLGRPRKETQVEGVQNRSK